MTLPRLRYRHINQRPYNPKNRLHNRHHYVVGTPPYARLDRTREVVDESYPRCFLGKGFEGESDERADVATRGEHGDFPTLEVACIDGAFFAPREHGDDTAKGGGVLEEWPVRQVSIGYLFRNARHIQRA